MDSQYTPSQKYFKLANLLLDIEVELKIATTSENKELSKFTKKLLRKIVESRDKNGI